MTDRLFDPRAYSRPHTTARDERAPRRKTEPPPVTRVALGETWRLMSNLKGLPEVHAVQNDRRGKLITICGVALEGPESMTRLTFDPGTIAAACPQCVAAGVTRDVL